MTRAPTRKRPSREKVREAAAVVACATTFIFAESCSEDNEACPMCSPPGSREVVKIGWATRIFKRLEALQTANAWPLTMVGYILDASQIEEHALHARFAKYRAHENGGSEWFLFDGALREYILSLRSKR